jgi:hypothetical protein
MRDSPFDRVRLSYRTPTARRSSTDLDQPLPEYRSLAASGVKQFTVDEQFRQFDLYPPTSTPRRAGVSPRSGKAARSILVRRVPHDKHEITSQWYNAFMHAMAPSDRYSYSYPGMGFANPTRPSHDQFPVGAPRRIGALLACVFGGVTQFTPAKLKME